MTTPGATEAVTPEQRARDVISRNPYGCIACGASLPNEDCGHRKNGVPNACMPAADNLEADLAQAIREAEANALRRCHDLADQKAQACAALADACAIGAAGPYSKPDRTILDKRWHTAQAAAFRETAHAIRSLLPKEEGN